jgi:hypothetical protein
MCLYVPMCFKIKKILRGGKNEFNPTLKSVG